MAGSAGRPYGRSLGRGGGRAAAATAWPLDLAQRAEICFRLIVLRLNGSLEAAMIIERLRREHRNVEWLLAVLERELKVFKYAGHTRFFAPSSAILHFIPRPTIIPRKT